MLDLPVPTGLAFHYANLHLTDTETGSRLSVLSDERQRDKALIVQKQGSPGSLKLDYEMTGAPPNVSPRIPNEINLPVGDAPDHRLRLTAQGTQDFVRADARDYTAYVTRPNMPQPLSCERYTQRATWVVTQR